MIYRRLTDGMELPEVMPIRERRVIDGLIGGRGIPWRLVEIDESQHFNPWRAMTLRYYPPDALVAYPITVWKAFSKTGRLSAGGGWAAPRPPLFPMDGGRHRQRAFRDALAGLLPPLHGFSPTLRLADFELHSWIWERSAVTKMRTLMEERLSVE